jgi:hypothetical protein
MRGLHQINYTKSLSQIPDADSTIHCGKKKYILKITFVKHSKHKGARGRGKIQSLEQNAEHYTT